jgi:hypothetical protein
VPFSDLVVACPHRSEGLCEVIAAYQTCVAYFCSQEIHRSGVELSSQPPQQPSTNYLDPRSVLQLCLRHYE